MKKNLLLVVAVLPYRFYGVFGQPHFAVAFPFESHPTGGRIPLLLAHAFGSVSISLISSTI